MSTHVPTESKLLPKAAEAHPEKLYAFQAYYLHAILQQSNAQPTPAYKDKLVAELQRALDAVAETGKTINVEHHDHWEAPRSGVALSYNLVRPLSENWADSLRQAPSKHEIYHLSAAEKAAVRRDAYFFTVSVGAIAFDIEH